MTSSSDQDAGGSNQTIRVVILEDEVYAREGMKRILDPCPDIDVVGASPDPETAFDLASEHCADVVIVDLRIAGGFDRSLGLIRQLRHRHPLVKCIVLTAFAKLQYFVASLEAGARAFISKEADPDLQPKLPDLVRMVAGGGRYYDPDLVEELLQHTDRSGPENGFSNQQSRSRELTKRETEVLMLLAAECSNAQIAEKLVISENTVKQHVKHILNKLGARHRRDAVLIGRCKGFITNRTS